MTDLYDIKIDIFHFLYSYDYLVFILIIVFLFLFYSILYYVLNYNYKKDIKIELNWNDFLKERYEYILSNISLPRDIFYRELGLFLKYVILNELKIDNKKVFFMTYSEIKNTFANSKYMSIFEEVYFLEFNYKKEDSLSERKRILEKIKI